jgi:hypothetical protein
VDGSGSGVSVEQTQTRPRPAREGWLRAARSRRLPAPRRPSPEILGYTLLGVALAALLWSHVGDVDGFYLDEWFYVNGSQYIWENLPGGLVETIPEWNRGPQRLYSTLLALTWGPFSPSTAFTLSHILNVLLLVSALLPTALLARRIIDSPLLRVLAVALGVAVPWLMIGSHQLAENLAFPLYLWAVYAIVCTAQQPSPVRQVATLAVIAALTLCRLGLAFVLGVFFVAVIAAELSRRRAERDEPLADWLRRMVRREAIVIAAAIVAAVVALMLSSRGSGSLGAYGHVDFDTAMERLFGAEASETRRVMLTYARSLIVGGFVFPFAIGLGVALAGLSGRAGQRLIVPSAVALSGAAAVIVATSIFTVGAALEERYVFYVYTPIAVLAVAGLTQIHRLRGWLIAGSALTIWPLLAGYSMAGGDAGNFFAAPGGAFWTRIVHHRLVGWEQDLFGWMFIGPTGWLLVAAGLGAMLVFVGLARDRPRLIASVLAAGLALCAVAQVAAMDYGFKQELNGTAEAPGGIALSDDRAADRETWLDDNVPDGESVAIMQGIHTWADRWGGMERLSFWNTAIDATVSTQWYGPVGPVPPGYAVVSTELGPDALVRWSPPPAWLAAPRDDPRVQFPGRLVAGSPVSRYGLYRTTRSDRAKWTSVGLQPDGAMLAETPVAMTLDPASAGGARAVVLSLQAAEGARRAVRWRLARGSREVAAGRLAPGRTREVRVPVPACPAGEACRPVRWTLRASGPSVDLPLPDFGPPGPVRPVMLMLTSVRIGPEA